MTSHVELLSRGYLYLYQSAVPVLLCMNIDCLKAIEVKHYVHGGIFVVYCDYVALGERNPLWAMSTRSFLARRSREEACVSFRGHRLEPFNWHLNENLQCL